MCSQSQSLKAEIKASTLNANDKAWMFEAKSKDVGSQAKAWHAIHLWLTAW